jgi:hypothetical protein
MKDPYGFAERFAQTQGIIPGAITDASPHYPIGIMLRVTYTEREGIKEVRQVVRLEW